MKTICALATARMNCAIHIIRVSGDRTYEIVQQICKKTIKKQGYIIQRNLIIDNDQLVDDVLLNTFVAPRSYTGEDLIEINCHGGVVVAETILSLLVKHGCEYAVRGEYTERAMLNKKIDMSQVEAINNLVHAENKYSIRGAIGALVGELSHELEKIQKQLFMVLGQIEVNIDYPEFDDVPQINDEQVKEILIKTEKEITNLLNKSRKFLPLAKGIKVAIVGKPNIGKSTLLNALSKEDKAIVSDIAGTTRDVVESEINLDGITLHLLDTAGIRNTDDMLENYGIERSYKAIEKADLILHLKEYDDTDDDLKIKLSKNQHLLDVYSKKDLYNEFIMKEIEMKDKDAIFISAKNNDLEPLIKAIKHLFIEKDFNEANLTVLQSQRQIDILENINFRIKVALESLEMGATLDLIAQELEECNRSLNDMLGKGQTYDFLDDLFANFCVGK